MKKLRVLQILNFWRLIPAYMCICMAPVEVKHVVIEELYHWKKCDKRKEVSRFDIFSGLMLERKEYRSLLQYRYSFRSNINPEKISNLETSFLLSHFFQ